MNKQYKKFLLLLILSLFVVSNVSFAQSNSKEIDKLLETYREYGQFNGTVLVAKDGKVIHQKGYGMANMEWDIPNQPDTKFRIGSVTKQFTATLILQLVSEGKIRLDGKITDYLPDYRKDTGDKITIHQLLNHTSGIPSYTALPGFFANDSRDPYSVADFIKKFASGDLEFEPGTKFNYNNSAYYLLGAIIEKVDGKKFAESLQKRILDPLGMKNTGYDVHQTILAKRARGYQKTPAGYENAAYLDMDIPYSAGSMYSTVEDLLKWDQALYGDKILSAESKKLMFTPGLENYGYGFFIEERPIGKSDKKVKIIQHGGGINGFNCLFSRAVGQKTTIIILDNVGQGQFHTKITDSIISILNGQPFDMPKRSIADTLYKTAMEKGGTSAVTEYRKLQSGAADTYDFSIDQLNMLGYQLLGRNKAKDAIEVFKLNVEMFPNESNPYDSLGEAYLKDGNKELALTNYKKAVELDPKNSAAREVVNRLEGKAVAVAPSILDTYIGEYELAPNFILTITRDGEKLMGQATGQAKVELVPVSESDFVITAINGNISFEKDSGGNVTGLMLSQNGQKIPAKKIK
ncbi:MAG: serine hydrolase [Acidobacteria bacterium]|nr:serine hydrolase [Acidobacteriota bacterium]